MTEGGVEFVAGGLRHPFGCGLARCCGECWVAEAVDLGPELGVAVEQRAGDAGGFGDGD